MEWKENFEKIIKKNITLIIKKKFNKFKKNK